MKKDWLTINGEDVEVRLPTPWDGMMFRIRSTYDNQKIKVIYQGLKKNEEQEVCGKKGSYIKLEAKNHKDVFSGKVKRFWLPTISLKLTKDQQEEEMRKRELSEMPTMEELGLD